MMWKQANEMNEIVISQNMHVGVSVGSETIADTRDKNQSENKTPALQRNQRE